MPSAQLINPFQIQMLWTILVKFHTPRQCYCPCCRVDVCVWAEQGRGQGGECSNKSLSWPGPGQLSYRCWVQTCERCLMMFAIEQYSGNEKAPLFSLSLYKGESMKIYWATVATWSLLLLCAWVVSNIGSVAVHLRGLRRRPWTCLISILLSSTLVYRGDSELQNIDWWWNDSI